MKSGFSLCAFLLLIGCADEPGHYMNHGGGIHPTCSQDKPYQAGEECVAEPFDVVNFSRGKSFLSPDGLIAVARQAAWLKMYPSVQQVIIKGYADDKGTDTDNLNLAQLRAIALKNRLISDGIASSRIATISCLIPTQNKGFCDAPSRVTGRSAFSN